MPTKKNTRTRMQKLKNAFTRAIGKKTNKNNASGTIETVIVPNLFEGYRVVLSNNKASGMQALRFVKHNPASADINDVFVEIVKKMYENYNQYDFETKETHYPFITAVLDKINNNTQTIDISNPLTEYKHELSAYIGHGHTHTDDTARTLITQAIKAIDSEYNKKENVYKLVRSLRTEGGIPLIIRNTIKQRVKDFKNTLTRKVKGIPSAFMSLFPKLSRSNPEAAEQLLNVTETVNNLPAEQQTSLANALLAVTNAVVATGPVHAKPLNVAAEMKFPSLTGYNSKTKKSNSGTRILLTPRHKVSGGLEEETDV